MKILVGTSNLGKIAEYKALLQPHFDPIPISDLKLTLDVNETGLTYEENALLKINYLKDKSPIQIITDDSGLEVEQLGGRPGVHSARYSGVNASDDSNIEKLLLELGNSQNRKGKFVCTIAYFNPLSREDVIISQGECAGEIITERRGTSGFGYDPIFYVTKFGKTLAELSQAEKNLISHRYEATKNLLKRINI